uniref:hypothetical protein n=1 Tax=Brachyspira catarrhinii TaxID=2528966 RepID=UPI003F4B2D1E
MFNKKAILLVIIFSLFVTSCKNYFNPYDVKDVKDETSSDNNEKIPPLPNAKNALIFTFTSIVFKNIDTRSANRNAITGNVDFFGRLYNHALFGYDMKLGLYSSSSDKRSLSSFASLFPKNIKSALELPLVTNDNIISKYIFLSKNHYLFYNENDDITVLIAVNLTKYDEKFGDFLYKVHYPYAYSENDKIKIELKYNKNNNNFELVRVHDEYKNRVKDSSLSVNENGETEVFMVIDGMDGPANQRHCLRGPTGWNNQIELTFKFKYEIIE